MSEVLAQLEKKGTTFQETVLWTNPNPTSTSGFEGRDVSLNDNISNYAYIKFLTNYNAWVTSKVIEIIIKADEFSNYIDGNGMYTTGFFIQGSDGTQYWRYLTYVSDTSVHFTNTINRTSGAITNANVIPYQIIGLK